MPLCYLFPAPNPPSTEQLHLSFHCMPAPWALPCTLHVSIHQLYWRDSKFPPPLTFGGVYPFLLSPGRKVEMLLPPLPAAAVWLLVKVRNHSSWTTLCYLSSISGAPTSRLWQCCEPAERLKWFLSPELLTHRFSAPHGAQRPGMVWALVERLKTVNEKTNKVSFLCKNRSVSLHPLHQEHSGIHRDLWSGPGFSGGSETKGRIQIQLRAFNFYLSNIKTFAQRCKPQPVNQSGGYFLVRKDVAFTWVKVTREHRTARVRLMDACLLRLET